MQKSPFEPARLSPGRRDPARRKALRFASLLIGTSLLHAAPAWAANDCGAPPPGGGTVTCPPGEYPTGIDYVAPSALEILLEPGVVTRGTSTIDVAGDFRMIGPTGTSLNVTPSDPAGSRALFVDADGSVFIRLDQVTDSIGGSSAGGGVRVRGSTFVDFSVNSVSTIGDNSNAIHIVQLPAAPALPGPTGILIQAGTVVTAGDSIGIYLSAVDGSLRTVVGAVTTQGYSSPGIYSNGNFGERNDIESGTVQTTGPYSTGILASQGLVHILSDSVTTAGLFSNGIETTSSQDLEVVSKSIGVTGPSSIGILAQTSAGGDIRVDSGQIHASTGRGIEAIANAGNIFIKSGTITKGGDEAIFARSRSGDVNVQSTTVISSDGSGVVALSADGNVRIVSGTVIAAGQGNSALQAASTDGDVDIVSETVTAENLIGIWGTSVTGNVAIRSGTVSTAGVGRDGIRASLNGSIERRTLAVDSGRVATTGPGSWGIVAQSGSENKISIVSDWIRTSGDNSGGIYASAFEVDIISGEVTTLGDGGSMGIYALASRDLSVTSGKIQVSGDSSFYPYLTGIYAWSYEGNVFVDSGTLSTSGYRSDGIYAESPQKQVTVIADDTRTTGDSAFAIRALSDTGSVSVTSGFASTQGSNSNAIGVATNGPGDSIVVADRTSTFGLGSDAISAGSFGRTSVTSNLATTAGRASDGIQAAAYGGSLDIRSGAISTTGPYSLGINSMGQYSDIQIFSDSVVTEANNSAGIRAVADRSGHVSVTSREVVTAGDDSGGIFAEADQDGVAVNNGGTVTTGGANSIGIRATGATVAIDSAAVGTAGGDSAGLFALATGNLDVASDAITTLGANSNGIFALSAGGDIRIVSGAIATAGAFSTAIFAATSGSGQATVQSGSIETAGAEAHGIVVQSGSGGVTVSSDSIRAAGASASGLIASTGSGPIAITSNTITAQGGRGLLALGGSGTIDISSKSIVANGSGLPALSAYGTGRITIDSGSVATSGQASTGILAESTAGPVGITSASVVTTGGSSGIEASTSTGAIRIVSGSVATSGSTSQGSSSGRDGTGIYAHSGAGSIAIEAGSVTAATSAGIYTQTGGEIAIKAGTVTARSLGILALGAGAITVEAGNVATPGGAGIFASGVRGPVTVTVDTVSGATGIGAFNSEGSISVNSNSIAAQGSGILAINSNGDTTIVSGEVRTTGPNGVGIEASANNFGGGLTGSGDIAVISRDVTTQGADSGGIRASALTGAVAVTSNGTIVTTGGNSPGLSAESGGPVVVSANNVSVSGANSDAIAVKGSSSRVTIRGLVQSSQGFAVRGEGGLRQSDGPGGPATVDILGGGTLRGRVSLTSASDLINNAGTFDLLGSSLFGSGADQFNNLAGGIVRALSGSATFAALESFANQGLIEMRDGATDDRLTLPGAYSGAGSALLGLDVDLTSGTADRLVTGAATGITTIDLRVAGQAAGLNSSILLVDAGAGTSATAFTLGAGMADTPYLRTTLRFDSASSDFFLAQAPGTAAFETARFAGLATGLWYESADAVAAQLDSARDSVRGRGLSLWLQGWTGDREGRGSQSFDGQLFDVSYDQDFQGLQGGIDYRMGAVAIGLTAGAGRSDALFGATGNPVDMDVRNIGFYLQGRSGVAFFSALAKFDEAELDIAPGAGLAATFDSNLFGIQANAGLRLAFGQVYAEPSVGLSWVQAEVDSFASGPATVGRADGESLRARAGLRVGAPLSLGGGTLVPFMATNVYEELEGRYENDFTLGQTLRLVDDRPGTRAEAAAGATFVAGRFEAFVRGDIDFSGGTDAKSARVGASLRF